MYDEDRVIDVGVRRAIEAFGAAGDPLHIGHTVQVTSFGGSGTTALIGHLLAAGVELQPGPAQWPFKHRRVPPTAEEVPPGFRVLYVVGDPRDAVLSVFRRGIQRGHWAALHHRPVEDAPPELASLESFLAGGVDHLDVLGHLRGWLSHPPGYEVLFVRYEHLGAVWSEIADFVRLPAGTPALEILPRSTDWRTLAEPMRRQLADIYAPMAELVDSLPPARIV